MSTAVLYESISFASSLHPHIMSTAVLYESISFASSLHPHIMSIAVLFCIIICFFLYTLTLCLLVQYFLSSKLKLNFTPLYVLQDQIPSLSIPIYLLLASIALQQLVALSAQAHRLLSLSRYSSLFFHSSYSLSRYSTPFFHSLDLTQAIPTQPS